MLHVMLEVSKERGRGGKAAQRLEWRWKEDETRSNRSVAFTLVLNEYGF